MTRPAPPPPLLLLPLLLLIGLAPPLAHSSAACRCLPPQPCFARAPWAQLNASVHGRLARGADPLRRACPPAAPPAPACAAALNASADALWVAAQPAGCDGDQPVTMTMSKAALPSPLYLSSSRSRFLLLLLLHLPPGLLDPVSLLTSSFFLLLLLLSSSFFFFFFFLLPCSSGL